MTSQQLATLKTSINASLNVVTGGDTIANHLAKSNFKAIADYYNSNSLVNIFRPDVPTEELSKSIVMTEFVALTVARQNGYFVLTQGKFIDATVANLRASFQTVFGTSISLTNLTAIAQRLATVFESLFVTNQVSSAYGVKVTEEDVSNAIK